jgi:hypothetical protein
MLTRTGCLHELNFRKSVSPARRQSENNKPRDDGNDNEHPILAIEAQQGKVFDQKVQRPAPPFLWAT